MYHRVVAYISAVNFIMILYLFVTELEISFWLAFPLIMACVSTLAIIDWIWIFPNEQERIWQKNPAFIQILNVIEEIKHDLKEKKEHEET